RRGSPSLSSSVAVSGGSRLLPLLLPFLDQALGLLRPDPVEDLQLLVGERAGGDEELLELLAHALRQLARVGPAVLALGAFGHGEQPMVGLAPVAVALLLRDQERADRLEHHDVERIPVFRHRRRHEAPIVRIAHAEDERAIEHEPLELGIVLELRDRAARRLDHADELAVVVPRRLAFAGARLKRATTTARQAVMTDVDVTTDRRAADLAEAEAFATSAGEL